MGGRLVWKETKLVFIDYIVGCKKSEQPIIYKSFKDFGKGWKYTAIGL